MAASRFLGMLPSKGDIDMKRFALILGLAVVLFAGVGLAAGTGSASAHDSPAFGETWQESAHPAPVGQNAFKAGPVSNPTTPGAHPGVFNGFTKAIDDGSTNAVVGITHNPNCPAHYNDH